MYLAKVIHGDGFSRLAAIKLLHPKWSENEEIASRMRDEARLLGWLRHKNIVDVMDLTMIDGRCAVIMEYLEAVDGKVVINWCVEEGQRIPLRVCLDICASVASALDAAYNRPPYAGEKPLRVIHRDIKPSNLMVDESGLVKVLDFGVARAEFDTREAKTQELSFGSLEYMPPERLFFEPDSAASDVYSLGATLFEMVALQKFGKAKLRGPDQEKFFEDRFEDLLERHPLPSEEIEDIFHDLLYDMLSFDEADRPTAADCVGRMRSFARRLTSMQGIEEWSERVIPTLVQRGQEVNPEGNPLVDRVLTEDTVGFSNVHEDTSEVLYTKTPSSHSSGVVPLASGVEFEEEEDVVSTGQQDDERWHALKRSTLQSLSEAGKIPAPPPLPDRLRTAEVVAPEHGEVPTIGATAPIEVEPEEPTLAQMTASADEEPSEEDATIYFPRGQEAVAALHEGVLPEGEEIVSKTVQFSRDDEDAMAAFFDETPDPADAREESSATDEVDEDEDEDDEESDPGHAFDEDDEATVARADELADFGAPTEDPTELSIPVVRPEKPVAITAPSSIAALPAPPAPKVSGASQQDKPARKRSWTMPILAMMALIFVVGGGAVLVTTAGVGGVGAMWVLGGSAPVEVGAPDPAAPPDPEPEPEPDPVPADPAPIPADPVEAAPPVEGSHFVSLLEGTKKIAVRCDNGKADGASEATVPGIDLGNCTVTAVDGSRKRQTAVVKLVEPRAYNCFRDGTKTCE